jgi:tRNA threonylcarbamoyl adenosine modification protein YeaZ
MEASKYGFALHTTTPELGLAISNFSEDTQYSQEVAMGWSKTPALQRCSKGTATRSQVWNLERELSSHLHHYLMDFIKPQTWRDMAFIAVAKGPGGFTGTRIGMVAARTLGQQLNIPVFAVSTLAAVALARGKGENINIAVQMPAQRGQVFGAIYQLAADGLGLTTLLTDTVFLPEAWQEKLAIYDAQEKSLRERNYQLIEAKSGIAATVTSILQLAYFDWLQSKRPSWDEALPFYGQHPVDL